MIVNSYKMSGDELKRIYKISGLKSPEFAAMLGLEKHQLYTQFSRMTKPIDLEIEVKLKSVPELAQHQLNLSVEPNKEVQQRNGPGLELWEKAFAMQNETLKLLSDDNKIIKELAGALMEDVAVFRSMVQQGIKDGLVKYALPGTKK